MDYSFGVRVVERARDLTYDLDRARERQRPPGAYDVFERAPAQELHDHVDDALFGLAEVRDVDGVRVRDARGGLGLAREARDYTVVCRERGVQNLYGDGLLHQDVSGAVDAAHPALVNLLLDAVLSGEHLPDQLVVAARTLQHRAVQRAQRVRVGVLPTACRTRLHL